MNLAIAASLAALFALAAGSCSRKPLSAVERLHPCAIDEGPTDAYCGTLQVFENREAKAGRKIGLKIVVMPALRRDPKPDPLFVFAGGPGQGAAKIARNIGAGFRRFQDSRDLVMIDQRGTGDSNPLDCKGPEHESDDLTNLAGDYPVDRFRDCLKKYDADPRYYTTPVAMDDIDEARRFLGYGQINLWGGSYGTRAALVYLRRHPDSVRTVTLDGVAPPDMRLPLSFARDGQRALDLLIRDCEADPSCAKRFPGIREKISRILKQLESNPRTSLTHPRTGERVQAPLNRDTIALILMSALYQPSVASLLPHLIDDAANGDFHGLLAMAFLGEGNDSNHLSQGMFLSVTCAEDIPRIRKEEIAPASANTFLGDAMFRTRMKPCDFWPVANVPEDYYRPVVSDKPVLILSGELDPVTPPSWGEHVARHLSNSKHIVVPGTGHGASNAGCVPKLMAKFVDAASPAGLDAECVTKVRRPPFFVTYSGPDPGKQEASTK